MSSQRYPGHSRAQLISGIWFNPTTCFNHFHKSFKCTSSPLELMFLLIEGKFELWVCHLLRQPSKLASMNWDWSSDYVHCRFQVCRAHTLMWHGFKNGFTSHGARTWLWIPGESSKCIQELAPLRVLCYKSIHLGTSSCSKLEVCNTEQLLKAKNNWTKKQTIRQRPRNHGKTINYWLTCIKITTNQIRIKLVKFSIAILHTLLRLWRLSRLSSEQSWTCCTWHLILTSCGRSQVVFQALAETLISPEHIRNQTYAKIMLRSAELIDSLVWYIDRLCCIPYPLCNYCTHHEEIENGHLKTAIATASIWLIWLIGRLWASKV